MEPKLLVTLIRRGSRDLWSKRAKDSTMRAAPRVLVWKFRRSCSASVEAWEWIPALLIRTSSLGNWRWNFEHAVSIDD